VILAGGLGTRLKPFTDHDPKPMYPVGGRPFLQYLLEQVRGFGISEVVLLLGYLPDKISAYFGDGAQLGLHIQYVTTPVEDDTARRLLAARDLLDEEFLFMYCDNLCPVNLSDLLWQHRESGSDIQMTAYANREGYTKDNLVIAADPRFARARIDGPAPQSGRVSVYDKKRTTPGLAGVDIGYAVIRRTALDLVEPADVAANVNFEACVYPKLVARGKLYATVCEARYYSCGSWARMELTEQYLSGRRCVFLDRDGTLNRRPERAHYIGRPEDFQWLDGAIAAIKRFNDAGWAVALVSNQPGVARGALSHDDLLAVQARMDADLAAAGAHIDAYYYCEHGWDADCFCRKPKPGMLYQGARDLCVNPQECYLIGDDPRDIEAGQAAGCTCYLVNEEFGVLDAAERILGA
jgi:D-glycero-D-manno-heptose 1,7-bisphosphate phosphatase